MKKFRLMMAALTFAAIAGPLAASHAACATTNDCDPFGGYEKKANGDAKCAPGTTEVPMVGFVLVDPAKGVYICNDGSNGSVLSSQAGNKVEGRIFVYKSGNAATVVVDGDDKDNSGGAKGWDRLDVNNGKAACFRRGSGGQAWNTNATSDNPDAPPSSGTPVCTPV